MYVRDKIKIIRLVEGLIYVYFERGDINTDRQQSREVLVRHGGDRERGEEKVGIVASIACKCGMKYQQCGVRIEVWIT